MALTAWNQWELTRAEFAEGAVVFNHLVFPVMTLSVALRRTAPLACATVAMAGLVAQTVWGGDVFGTAGQFVALLVATHAVGSHPDRRRAWVGLVVVLIGVETYPVVNVDQIVLADEIGNVSSSLRSGVSPTPCGPARNAASASPSSRSGGSAKPSSVSGRGSHASFTTSSPTGSP